MEQVLDEIGEAMLVMCPKGTVHRSAVGSPVNYRDLAYRGMSVVVNEDTTDGTLSVSAYPDDMFEWYATDESRRATLPELHLGSEYEDAYSWYFEPGSADAMKDLAADLVRVGMGYMGLEWCVNTIAFIMGQEFAEAQISSEGRTVSLYFSGVPYNTEEASVSTQIKVLLGTSGDTRGPIAVYFGNSSAEHPWSDTYSDRICSRVSEGCEAPDNWVTFFNTDPEDLENLFNFVTRLVEDARYDYFGCPVKSPPFGW